jgi:hypothetical protein
VGANVERGRVGSRSFSFPLGSGQEQNTHL